MKNMKKKYIYSTLALVSIFFASCDNFGHLNTSPNGSTVPLTTALLTNAESAIGGAVASPGLADGLYCQYFAQTQYTDLSRYAVNDSRWNEMNGNMEDLQKIIDINTDPATKDYAALNGSNNYQIAMARILKAYRFWYLTDRYGDMPYFEALKGVVNPKYDTQQDIYTDLSN